MAPVVKTLQNVSFVTGLFGISQVSRAPGPNPKFQLTQRRVVYSIVLLCTQLCYIPLFYVFYESKEDVHDQLAEIYMTFIHPFNIYYTIIFSLMHRKILEKCLNKILLTNDKLTKSTGSLVAVPKAYGVLFLICYLCFYCTGVQDWSDTMYNIITFIVFIYTFLVIFQMGTYALAIGCLLKYLNQELKKCLEDMFQCEINFPLKTMGSEPGMSMIALNSAVSNKMLSLDNRNLWVTIPKPTGRRRSTGFVDSGTPMYSDWAQGRQLTDLR